MTTNEPNTKVSAKEFFALLGCDISDISSFYGNEDKLFLTVKMKNADGTYMLVGPSFAQNIRTKEVVVELVKPGRPMGTTVANGASPKIKAKLTPGEMIIAAKDIHK